MSSIAVLRPTRGLEFTRSSTALRTAIAAAFRLGHFVQHKWLTSEDLPLPDCFNDVTRRFLNDTNAEYAWFVEEDVVVPRDAVAQMLVLNVDVAAINYYLKAGNKRLSELRGSDGKLYSISTGCTLVRRKVFERMLQTDRGDIFRCDLAPAIVREGQHPERRELVKAPGGYGGHDAYFTFRAQQLGFSIATVPELRCIHLKLNALGKPDANDGCHSIAEVE